MSLLGPLLELADGITNSLGLQADVTHNVLTGSPSGSGAKNFTVVSRKAIVEKKRKLVRVLGGEEVMSQASVTFLSPVVIGLHDEIILPDGTTGPILATAGFMDDTNANILTEIFLGM